MPTITPVFNLSPNGFHEANIVANQITQDVLDNCLIIVDFAPPLGGVPPRAWINLPWFVGEQFMVYYYVGNTLTLRTNNPDWGNSDSWFKWAIVRGQ